MLRRTSELFKRAKNFTSEDKGSGHFQKFSWKLNLLVKNCNFLQIPPKFLKNLSIDNLWENLSKTFEVVMKSHIKQLKLLFYISRCLANFDNGAIKNYYLYIFGILNISSYSKHFFS